MATLALGAWLGRAHLLPALAAPLAVEDSLAPADVIVVSVAAGRADALEAAALYHAGISRRLVLPRWRTEPLDLEVQRLGVPWLLPTDVALAILERSAVPRDAIEILEEPVDGLNSEIAAVGRFFTAHPTGSLLFITARSHSRRARWLLTHVLPADTHIAVRASRKDPFDPAAWWYTRAGGREVAMEYLRWANTFLLRDRWQAVPEEAN